jgi:hypothetical protein
MKFLPRYSLRQILVAMIAMAGVMACLASAHRGSLLGFCLIASIVSLCLPLVCIGLVYWGSWLVQRVIDRRWSRKLLLSGLLVCPWNDVTPWPTQSLACAQATVPAGKNGYVITIDDSFPMSDVGFTTIRLKMQKSPARRAKQREIFTVVVASQHQYPATQTSATTLIIEPGEVAGEVELAVPSNGVQFRYLNLGIKRGLDNSAPNNRRDFFNQYIHSSSSGTSAIGAQPGIIWVTSLANKDVGTTHAVWDRNVGTNVGGAPSNILSPGVGESIAAEIFDVVDGFATLTTSIGGVAVIIREPRPFHPENLPDELIGISGIKMILITMDELTNLSQKHVSKLMLLQNWVAMGGTLVVFDLDGRLKPGDSKAKSVSSPAADWKRLQEIMPMLLQDRMEELEDWTERWWRLNLRKLADPVAVKRNYWLPVDPSSTKNQELPFLMLTHVQGRVIAVPNHFENWRSKDWKTLSEAVRLSGGSFPTFTSIDSNDDANVSIPGVGEPPLMAFQLLMILFVLLAGPGVYYVLKLSQQMQLFFFVVPVLASISCLALLTYVVIAEGFGSYGRTQTVTWVDHRNQTAVTQARSLYYHGLAPRPYRHGANAIPLECIDAADSKIWKNDGETLVSGGLIQPREPHRFVNLSVVRMQKAIRIQPVSDEDTNSQQQSYRISNGLGNRVEYIVFRSDSGLYKAERIGDGQSVIANRVDPTSAHRELSKLVNDLAPLNSRGWSPEEKCIQSEAGIIDVLRNCEINPLALDQWMAKNSYVAILSDFSEVQPLLQKVDFKYRLHVVVGQW